MTTLRVCHLCQAVNIRDFVLGLAAGIVVVAVAIICALSAYHLAIDLSIP